jgi:riboflavin synthase
MSSEDRAGRHHGSVGIMFTGIVQSVGVVRSLRPGGPVARLELDAPDLTRPIPAGASVCVSGVCLTVTACDPRIVSFDVVPETLSRSTLGRLSPGGRVNLERSLRAGDGLDGHIVQGHVDGVARVARITNGVDGHVIAFEASPELMPYIIPKGSVAVDGVSLTIADVSGDTFSVALIPTTLDATTLGGLRVGGHVNIETDILARTVVSTLRRWGSREGVANGGLTIESLLENGW